jgi:hypothetical protein
MDAYYYVVTEEKLQKPQDKIFKGLKVALRHLVFDFDSSQLQKDSVK